MNSSGRVRIVIVGCGFGGLFAAKALRRTPADVLVIDRNNYHLFQPLLYQVASAALAPGGYRPAGAHHPANPERMRASCSPR